MGRLFYRQSEIADYRREGKPLSATVLATSGSYLKSNSYAYRIYGFVLGTLLLIWLGFRRR